MTEHRNIQNVERLLFFLHVCFNHTKVCFPINVFILSTGDITVGDLQVSNLQPKIEASHSHICKM